MSSTDHASGKLPKLSRSVNWDVFSAQFEEYVRLKGVARWLDNEPDPSAAGEVSGDATCKGHMILSTTVVALIRLIKKTSSAKAAWAALKQDFLGRERIRRHEINRESKDFRQTKGESFTAYCDRAADHHAQVESVGGSTLQFADDFIIGLSEPFRSNNNARLTKLVDEFGFDELISEVRQSSRLCTVNTRQDATVLAAAGGKQYAAAGGKQYKFKGKCHHCGKIGHKKTDCRQKKYEERQGEHSPNVPRSGVPPRPAAAFVCEGVAVAAHGVAGGAAHETVLFDTCCTHHVVVHSKYLTNFVESDVQFMRMGGNEKHPVLGEGTAVIQGGPKGEIVLKRTLLVPSMIHNIVSSGKVSQGGSKVVLEGDGVEIQRHSDRAVVLTGTIGHGMYELFAHLKEFSPACAQSQDESDHSSESEAESADGCALSASAVPLRLAHERLGHLSVPQVKQVAASDAVTGLKIADPHAMLDACITCSEAKQTRASFPASESTVSKPLEIVHMDTIGPIRQMGYDGSRYAVPVHDEYSAYCAVLCVQGKDQIADAVIELLTFWQRQTGQLVLTVRSDNGTEFQGDFDVWCTQHGVHRQYSAVYTPEQNGRAERMNRTIIERTRALLLQRDCPFKFWPLGMHAGGFIRNRVPIVGARYSPLEYMFGKIPDLSMLRVFGCSASISTPKKKRGGKFNAVSSSGVFVGYCEGTKGWRVAVGNTVHESPSVVFREGMTGDASLKQIAYETDSDSDNDVDVATGGLHIHGAAPPAEPLHQLPGQSDSDGASVGDTQVEEPVDMAPEVQPQGRPVRVRNAPDRFVPGNAVQAAGVVAPADLSALLDPTCVMGQAFAVTGQTVPKNYADIANWGDMQDLWYASYNKELSSIKEMQVFEEIAEKDVPVGARILTSKLHFANKYGPDGAITDRKTRLCAHGYKQVEGLDFTETTAPTAAANSTRMFFAEAAYRDLHVHQMDVKTAFLHAPLEEELYMRPPLGIPELKGKIWRLHKAIYGLKQAANAWHAKLSAELCTFGFTPCLTDPCLFIKKTGERRTYLLVYVDDMLIGGELSDVLLAKQHVAKCFKTKDLGVAYYFLGFLIHRDAFGIRLTQEQYTKVVLERFGYEKAHAKRTPFNEGTAKESAVRCQCQGAEKKKTHLRVVPEDCTCAPYDSEIDFPAFVGAVMFLATRSRPDISYSLGVLSRFVSAPMAFHEPLVKHLLRYLQGTIDWGLWYPSGRYLRECSEKIPEHLLLFTDSDHSGEEKKRSTSGWVVQVHGSTVAWGSKLQPTAVESTCAAEFIAACMGENAAMCLKDLLFEMTGKQVSAELLVDNQSAVGKLNRPAGGNMWLDLKWRVVHQRHVDKFVSIRYIPTTEQKADVFTKNLTPAKQEEAVSMLSMYGNKMKSEEYEVEEERSGLLHKGVQVPLEKHTCIYKGAKECVTCKKFYAAFK